MIIGAVERQWVQRFGEGITYLGWRALS
jgi:hypothetical protein